jgi:hypothetical protein
MQHIQLKSAASKKFAVKICSLGFVALLVCIAGCGGSDTSATPAPATPGPQNYFGPYVAGTTNGNILFTGAKSYAIDDVANTFSESTFLIASTTQQGPQVINSGNIAPGQRGLLDLSIATNYVSNSNGTFSATNYTPLKTGSFAVELAGQAGGLIQLVGQPASPLVAAVQCPNATMTQTYQFMTIPAALVGPGVVPIPAATWDPTTDTAYGSVDISTNGGSISFSNIHQYTLPSVGGPGTPAQIPSSPVMGTCASTVLGNTITVGQLTATNPVPGNGVNTPPQASVGIGPTGLLVEHNGVDDTGGTVPGTSPALKYDNTLGAGTGAVGLPQPSSALNTGALVGAQYLGFVYGAGVFVNSSSPAGWSSHLASFGFSTLPSSCASVAASTSTLIYGGDFPQANGQDNPSASSNGFGNCDLAIDLGTQSPSNNGSYPQATVWMGASYAANTTGKTYSFPAVAIAGQLNGKNAIFVLGADSTQPWAIYLLQSN